MKQLIVILIFACFGCAKEDTERFFDPDKVNSLNVETITGFWEDDSIRDTSYYMGAHFENYDGFIKGIRLSGNTKAIWISVFKSKAEAIEAMELRINDVACVIQNGNSDVIKGECWFSECTGTNIVFVNQLNTIIEVDYNHSNFLEIENVLYSTANEVATRVDKLSNEMK